MQITIQNCCKYLCETIYIVLNLANNNSHHDRYFDLDII